VRLTVARSSGEGPDHFKEEAIAMVDIKRGAALVAACAALACAPAALASGGVNSGGVNSGGVNSGGGGGGTDPSTSCVSVGKFGSSVGYYSVWAAIWTNYSISNSCGYGLNATITYTNGNTGAVDFTGYPTANAGSNGGTIDEDWAAFSTTYTVRLTVTDPYSGAVLASKSQLVTTPASKTSA
jgi:hypothetical protein